MKISHIWLQEYFKAPLPQASELEDLFNTHAFEIEGIEEKEADKVLDIKVLPDRAHYALCHYGIAREVKAITGMTLDKPVLPKVISDSVVSAPQVTVLDSHLCKRYIVRRIENISVTTSNSDTISKLESIGQRSINSIVDATNYVMFDIGQPLHAFDADKVVGGIVVRLAKTDEKIVLLDGSEVTLKSTDLVIADDSGPLAIAGVKGGKRAEVTVGTKNIILESANFDSVCVRKTSTRLNLRNESSKRFENAISPELCMEAMERVSSFIQSFSKDIRTSVVTDIYPVPIQPWSVTISAQDIAERIGVNIAIAESVSILQRMNCVVTESSGVLTITPPTDRLDMIIPEDIVDEVGRIYGYDKVTSVLPPKLSEEVLIDKTFYYAEKVKNILSERGFSEVLLYSLVPKGVFEIAYPLASDKAALRESIAPKLSDSLLMNTRNADFLELDEIKIFEIGKVFKKGGECTSLCFGVSVFRKKKSSAEGIALEALRAIEADLGVTMAIKPQLTPAGAIVEIDFDELIASLSQPKDIKDLNFKILSPHIRYKAFSVYPFASRDVAVFVPSNVSEKTVSDLIKSVAGEYCIKMRLFDVFKKKDESGVEKISYAFRLIFQSYEKTLEESEINAAMDAVTATLNQQEGWKVR